MCVRVVKEDFKKDKKRKKKPNPKRIWNKSERINATIPASPSFEIYQ